MSDWPTRFNHVAMSMPPDALDDANRSDICSFYGHLFGWEELPTMTLDRERLVLSVHAIDQFVFLIASDEPMATARLDHFGLAANSLGDLNAVLTRAKAYRDRDERVDLIDYAVEDHGVLKLHSFYVGYLLPLMVEVQYFEFTSVQ